MTLFEFSSGGKKMPRKFNIFFGGSEKLHIFAFPKRNAGFVSRLVLEILNLAIGVRFSYPLPESRSVSLIGFFDSDNGVMSDFLRALSSFGA